MALVAAARSSVGATSVFTVSSKLTTPTFTLSGTLAR